MADELYADFEVPAVNAEDGETLKYYPSLLFDYNTGDFQLDGSGRIAAARGQIAYKQWCIKTILTERYACLAYGPNIGTEMTRVSMLQDYDAQCSDIERQYTEALMANPKTEYVRDFMFSQPAPDSVSVTFTVKGKEYDEESINILIRRG